MRNDVIRVNYLSNRNNLVVIKLLFLAAFIVSTLFILQGNIGFNLWDEGYLWYGAQRVLLGEVPIRDFMSYDPGRYYWSAMFMYIWDDSGIMALRRSVAVFQVVGLFVGLKLLSDTVKKQDYLYLVLSSITLLVWMFPWHKLFDISLSIFLIGILTFLIKQTDSRRYILGGVGIGLLAVFGRNHGLYGVIGALSVVAWSSIGQEEIGLIKKITHLFVGFAVGFSPIFYMFIMMPGFGEAFIDSTLFLFEVKSTNLPLPIPWPWLVDFSGAHVGNVIRNVLIGLLFMGLIVFGVLSIAWLIWQKLRNKKINPVFVAASFLVLPYAHFAYSRADISHLAQAIFPFLIGCMVLLGSRPVRVRWTGAILVCLVSLWVMPHYQPGWQCYTRVECVEVEISGDTLQVDRRTEADVGLLRELAEQYSPNNNSFVVYPFWPGAYALLDRKSPVWEIYALFPRPLAFEQTEIERIKMAKPGFVFIYDKALNGRNELRFRNTHPFTYQYILDNYNMLPGSPKSAYQIYISKESI